MRAIGGILLCMLLASCGMGRVVERLPLGRGEVSRAAPPPAAFTASSGKQALNAFRAENGLGPLTRSPQLEQAASAHARDMARRGYFDHRAPDGGDPMTRAQQAGYQPCYISENIAQGQRSLQEVMAGWANSPGHRRNMLSASATEYGLVRGEGDRWVMVLGRSC